MSQPPVLHVPDPDQTPSPSGTYRSLKDGDLSNSLSLGEFFETLGWIIRLPAKQPKKPEKPPTPKRPTRFVLPMVATALAVLLVAFAPHGKPEPARLPGNLLGVWHTNHEKYQGRLMIISPGSVVFQAGPDSSARTVHLVTRVRSVQFGDTLRYTLTYLEEGAPYELTFKYASTPEVGIRFSNQQDLIWRPGPAPAPAQ